MDNFTAKNWNSMIRPVALEAEGESLKNDYGKLLVKILLLSYDFV